MDGFGTYLRILLGLGTVLTGVVFLIQVAIAWRNLSWGQKMFDVAVLCFMVYIADAIRASIAQGLDWNTRLGFLAVGLTSFAAFLMEPRNSRRRRWRGVHESRHPEHPLE